MYLDLLCPSSFSSCVTVCDSNFWLELNYLEVARAAQSCSAHFTALLYTEIYVDKIKANMEESRRCTAGCFPARLYMMFELNFLMLIHVNLQNQVQSITQDQL